MKLTKFEILSAIVGLLTVLAVAISGEPRDIVTPTTTQIVVGIVAAILYILGAILAFTEKTELSDSAFILSTVLGTPVGMWWLSYLYNGWGFGYVGSVIAILVSTLLCWHAVNKDHLDERWRFLQRFLKVF